MTATSCPCGSSLDFADCCGPLLDGDTQAETAEQLMRSRYSAYVTGNREYLLASWHRDTRPRNLQLDTQPATRWIGLKIVATQEGQSGDSEGRVEFIARYKINGRASRLRENSRFVREQGRWFYLDGETDQ